MLYQPLTGEMTFPAAFELWLNERIIESNGLPTDARYLAPKTVNDYRVCARALSKFFYRLRLSEIEPGHMMQYQHARAVCDLSAAHWARPAGANCIRKEMALLIRILKAARCWGDTHTLHFRRLQAVEKDVPRAMTPEEQHRFLHIASTREDWRFVYCWSILALQTTCCVKELRTLKLGDIFLREGYIEIRRKNAKNRYRSRTIPLVSEDVCWALERLIERARQLGSGGPHHHLFPIREAGGTYDPMRPMSEQGIAKRWNRVRRAAGLPWLRPNDLRHTAITRLAESQTPLHVILAMAGHIDMKMQQHYTAVSMRAKRGWAQAAWAAPETRGAPAAPPKFGPKAAHAEEVAMGPWQVRSSSREAL